MAGSKKLTTAPPAQRKNILFRVCSKLLEELLKLPPGLNGDDDDDDEVPLLKPPPGLNGEDEEDEELPLPLLLLKLLRVGVVKRVTMQAIAQAADVRIGSTWEMCHKTP